MPSTTVDTASGRVRGVRRRGVLRVAGLPYAAPPVGSLRFLPPAPHPGWGGTRDATSFGHEAPQQTPSKRFPRGLRRAEEHEDCLVLDVYTPAADGGRRPVLVWLHGGSFVDGSGSRLPCDPTPLVRANDVVVVTPNYRLGLLGWLHLEQLDDRCAESGNHGLLDQVAALRWVRDNIDAFGGDAGRVTVFGTSAGGTCASALLASPSAEGLFERAVVQSGSPHAVRSVESATALADRVVTDLGARGLSSLQDVPVAALLGVQRRVLGELAVGDAMVPRLDTFLHLGPVVTGATLPVTPLEALRRGAAAGVPVVCGFNRDEWRVMRMFGGDEPSEPELRTWLEHLVGDRAGAVDAVYRAACGDDPAGIKEMVQTDRRFFVPSVRLVEAQRAHLPEQTYHYRFDWAGDAESGAGHGIEQPFVFGNLRPWRLSVFTPMVGLRPPAPLSRDIRAAWTAFADSGRPSAAGLPSWSPYGTDRATMCLDRRSTVERAITADRLAVWDSLL